MDARNARACSVCGYICKINAKLCALLELNCNFFLCSSITLSIRVSACLICLYKEIICKVIRLQIRFKRWPKFGLKSPAFLFSNLKTIFYDLFTFQHLRLVENANAHSKNNKQGFTDIKINKPHMGVEKVIWNWKLRVIQERERAR
jgi:hypothetical protein